MAKLIWAISCQAATVDQQTNQITLVNVLENINTPDIPSVFPSLTIAILWEREVPSVNSPEAFEFRIRIRHPSGSFTNPPEQFEELKAEIPRDKIRLRSIISMNGLPIQEEGRLEFLIEIKRRRNWEIVGSVPIFVKRTVLPN